MQNNEKQGVIVWDASYNEEWQSHDNVDVFEAGTAMTIKWSFCVLLLWASAALADEPARLVLSSATDFTDISVTLKRSTNLDLDVIPVSVVLSPEASARAKSISLLAYHKYLTLYIDGHQLSTAMVHSALGGEFSFQAPRALVIEWMSEFSNGAIAPQPTM